MGIKTLVVAVASVVTVAGCFGAEDVAEAQGSEICEPETFEFLIGQDKSALEGVTVPEMLRVMQDGSPATMDFHENRLNVIHDTDGKIVAVTCG
ncbi:Peptidase inhibitor I78 family protein [Shimia sp. SK013]|uniref:I78 family peptidase inhibitor n=1 Tax=Shimia sp. SK013 TaxID=1389006 RepID=UPI0006B53B14|nr:I78 family peptidase inhibitor [Shimia sp. SK013]KPA23738.1 Peptidase inhibitor I78 family protein [Shimia sp. SK013]